MILDCMWQLAIVDRARACVAIPYDLLRSMQVDVVSENDVWSAHASATANSMDQSTSPHIHAMPMESIQLAIVVVSKRLQESGSSSIVYC